MVASLRYRRTLFFGFIYLGLFCFPVQASAVVCANKTGSAATITFDLDEAIASGNNVVGSNVDVSKASIGSVYAICPKTGSSKIPSYRSYKSSMSIAETVGNYKFLKINDYLEGAMSITDTDAGTFYPPVDYAQMGSTKVVAQGKEFEIKDTALIFRLKVTKKILGTLNIPDTQLFTVYVTTTTSDALTTPVYYISINGSIDVPQSCEVNAGDTIDIDFGSLSAAAFSAAGAGNKPEDAATKSVSLSVVCDNVDTSSLLKLRVEADHTSGSIIVANNNNDVGFILADSSNNILIPNDLTSTSGFHLNENSEAAVTINAWPVSVTGNTPVPGEYQATGYLRIDYD